SNAPCGIGFYGTAICRRVLRSQLSEPGKGLARISKWRFRPGHSRLCGKTPIPIKSVDIIKQKPFSSPPIIALLERRRNARHNCGRDFTDTALCGSVNVPAEAGYNPEGALQNLAQP